MSWRTATGTLTEKEPPGSRRRQTHCLSSSHPRPRHTHTHTHTQARVEKAREALSEFLISRHLHDLNQRRKLEGQGRARALFRLYRVVSDICGGYAAQDHQLKAFATLKPRDAAAQRGESADAFQELRRIQGLPIFLLFPSVHIIVIVCCMSDEYFTGDLSNPEDIEVLHTYFGVSCLAEKCVPNPDNHSTQPTLIPGSILIPLDQSWRILHSDVDDIEYSNSQGMTRRFRMWAVDGFEAGTLPQFVPTDRGCVARSRFEELGGGETAPENAGTNDSVGVW